MSGIKFNIVVKFEIIPDEVLETTLEGHRKAKDLIVDALEAYKDKASEIELKMIDKLFNDYQSCPDGE